MQTSVPVQSNSRILYARNNNFSAFSPSKLLRRSEEVCPAALNSCSLAALVGGADKNFLAGAAIDTSRLQQQRQQTESAHCLLPHNTHMLCGWRCRQRLYATAGDSEFCLPCIGSTKVLTFFFVFTAILVPKKEKKRKCGCLFRPKNKKCFFRRQYSLYCLHSPRPPSCIKGGEGREMGMKERGKEKEP